MNFIYNSGDEEILKKNVAKLHAKVTSNTACDFIDGEIEQISQWE